MRHLLLIRVLRALLAVWFVLSVGEPSVVRICPMHASAAAELADARVAGHHAHHGASTHSHSSGQHQQQHHCTCISCCVGSSSSALAPSRVQLALARVLATAQAVSRADEVALEVPAYLLPPGTGPPRT